MYYKELRKYLKDNGRMPQSCYMEAISTDPNNAPMARIMKEYFGNMGLGDLINDFTNHKNKPFFKRMSKYHKELERIYIKMINVLITWNDTKFDDRF